MLLAAKLDLRAHRASRVRTSDHFSTSTSVTKPEEARLIPGIVKNIRASVVFTDIEQAR